MGKFDEILDDVVVNAKAAASVVSKKASTVYDTSKHKISAAEIRGEINKKLKDLGKLTYKSEVHSIDLSEEIAKTIDEIKELKDNLDIINNHIDSIKNQKKCPHCDAKIPKNSLFCNICGAKIEDSPVYEEAKEAASETVEEGKEEASEAVEEAEDIAGEIV